jgi:hypothetical protein
VTGPVDPAPGGADRPVSGDPDDATRPLDRRPWLERIGLAAIALVLFALLSVMAVASWAGGEWILAAMSASGAVLTIGVALMTLVRG